MNSVKERIVREIKRRIETQTFANVAFNRVTRRDLPPEYNGEQGSILAILEEDEVFATTAARVMDCEMNLLLNFAVPLAANEEAATVMNNVSAELVRALSGQKQLEEGGDGTGGAMLACYLKPLGVQASALDDGDVCAVGEVRFKVTFRTAVHDPFTLRQ